MVYEKIKLGIGNAYLTVIKPIGLKNNEAMLVIPGGGYNVVCDDREGEPIAITFASKGFTSFILEYSIREAAKGHQPLMEASAAIAFIRENADKYGIDAEKVYAVGFSAGGHLAGSLATMWHRKEIYEKTGISYGSNRPNGVILCYPVVTGLENAHKESFYNIIGSTTPSKEQLTYYSVEKQVDENTAPAFIMHTANDTIVPVENALYLAESYSKAKIPFELHIYPDGPHGLALANEVTECGNPDWIRPQAARWVDDAIKFLRAL